MAVHARKDYDRFQEPEELYNFIPSVEEWRDRNQSIIKSPDMPDSAL